MNVSWKILFLLLSNSMEENKKSMFAVGREYYGRWRKIVSRETTLMKPLYTRFSCKYEKKKRRGDVELLSDSSLIKNAPAVFFSNSRSLPRGRERQRESRDRSPSCLSCDRFHRWSQDFWECERETKNCYVVLLSSFCVNLLLVDITHIYIYKINQPLTKKK